MFTRLVAIDPGWNTGLARAAITEGKELVWQDSYTISNLEYERIIELTRQIQPHILIIERPAQGQGSDRLTGWQFERVTKDLADLKPIILQPSTWKPFFGPPSRNGKLLRAQLGRSAHEHDAMGMIYYHLYTALGGKAPKWELLKKELQG